MKHTKLVPESVWQHEVQLPVTLKEKSINFGTDIFQESSGADSFQLGEQG